jgi:hypothetical protein
MKRSLFCRVAAPFNKSFQPTRYSALFFRSFAIFASEKPAVTGG